MKKILTIIIQTYRSLGRRLNNFRYKILFCHLGTNTQICGKVFIENPHLISVGDNVVINHFCILQTGQLATIHIGNNVTLSYGVKIITGGLKLPVDENRTHDFKNVYIDDNVWVGANVTILSDVTIGSNVVIAAGSVVIKDVSPNSIVGGIPAKFLKKIDKV